MGHLKNPTADTVRKADNFAVIMDETTDLAYLPSIRTKLEVFQDINNTVKISCPRGRGKI